MIETRDGDKTSIPCVTYECSLDLVVTAISSNCFDLIGIRPENIGAKRTLWQERIPPVERDRLMAQVSQIRGAEVGNLTHKLIDDRGSYVSVAHSFRKVTRNEQDESLQGCIIPLTHEFRSATFSDLVVSQFIHKMGNHFQLINLLIGSLNQSGANVDEIDTLRLAVDRAVDFTRAFSHYCQRPAFTSPVKLGEILVSAVRTIEPLIDEKKVSLQVAPPDFLMDVRVIADAYLLEFALTAVLQNAVDATEPGDRIVVSCKKSSNALGRKSAIRIAIVDSGSGMEKNLLAKVVDPFITSKKDRDGLGLSTAARVIENHGGQLRVSSAPGKGTKVEILLPVELPTDSSSRL